MSATSPSLNREVELIAHLCSSAYGIVSVQSHNVTELRTAVVRGLLAQRCLNGRGLGFAHF